MKKIACTICTIAVMLGGLLITRPAFADVPAVPDDVIDWFANQAPRIIGTQSSAGPGSTSSMDNPMYPFGATVGKPITIMTWSADFLLAAEPSADLLSVRGDWIAPIMSGSKAVGTIIAERLSTGGFSYMWDTDIDAGAALSTLARGSMVASDAINGYFIVSGSSVRQVAMSNAGIRSAAGSLLQLQAALLVQRADIDAMVQANNGEPVGGPSALDFGAFIQQQQTSNNGLDQSESSSGIDTLLIVILALAALGLATAAFFGGRHVGIRSHTSD